MSDLENYANSATRNQGKGNVKDQRGRFGESKRGEGLRFCRIGKGMWGLTEWGLTPVEVEVAKSKGKKKRGE